MNRSITVLACFVITGCGGARSAPSTTSSGSNDGVYEFSAVVPTTQQGTQRAVSTLRVTGTLSVVNDSLLVQPGPNCYLGPYGAPGPATSRVETIYCGSATLTFDKRNPASARWSATVQVPKQRNACAQYETRPPTGNSPRCIQYRVETYYVSERRTGAVQVKRIT